MTQEQTPDKNVPAKTDDQHLEADLTDDELTAVAGGRASKWVPLNGTGMLPGAKTGPGR